MDGCELSAEFRHILGALCRGLFGSARLRVLWVVKPGALLPGVEIQLLVGLPALLVNVLYCGIAGQRTTLRCSRLGVDWWEGREGAGGYAAEEGSCEGFEGMA